jgi:hypothetical protein
MTSIDFLFEKLWNEPKDKLTWHSILNKALERHKQEIIDSYTDGSNMYRNAEWEKPKGEEYYKFKFHKP